MSLSHSLANALTGLTAQARMAELVSSNLANVMTDGYARRSLELSAQTIGGRGAGVSIDGIERRADRAITTDRRITQSELSAQETLAKTLSRLETAIGGTDDQGSVANRIMALEAALVAASADPSSDIRLAAVNDRLTEVTNVLHTGAVEIKKLREEADQSIKTQVDSLNAALGQMELLNKDIAVANARGQDASALLDQREVVIDKIAAIVPVRVMDRQNGVLALVTQGGATLIDGRAAVIGFAATPTITPDMSFASSTLSGLTLNGEPIDLNNGIGRLTGGSLGAAFTLRDHTLVTAQDGLDAVAADLIGRLQDPAIDPTLNPGDAGLLTDAGIAFDPLNGVGLSARIGVNAAIDPTQGGALFRFRDGINAVTPGPIGNASQLDTWLDALDAALVPATGGRAGSASDNASGFASSLGAIRLSNDAEMSYTSARFSAYRATELSLGVDSDEEMQLLLQIEQAYAANARVIETVEGLFRTLMEI